MKIRLPSIVIGLLAVFVPLVSLARVGVFTSPNLVGVYGPSWLPVVGSALMLVGFVIGLGAVTVIDWHGFLARRSQYWTVATTRTHKITKPLIWAGIILVASGGGMVYGELSLRDLGPLLLHIILMVVLLLNGLFLSFRVSPFLIKREQIGRDAELLPVRWQHKITASFVVSLIGWWGSLALFFLFLVR